MADEAASEPNIHELRQRVRQGPMDVQACKQLAEALVWHIGVPTPEQSSQRCRVWLDEIRGLSASHPEDADLRESYAQALFRMVMASGRSQRVTQELDFLGDLRTVAAACPDDARVRRWLLRSLELTMMYGEATSSAASLDELRLLASRFPLDTVAQTGLARCLVDLARRSSRHTRGPIEDGPLPELRALVGSRPASRGVRRHAAEWLAHLISSETKRGSRSV